MSKIRIMDDDHIDPEWHLVFNEGRLDFGNYSYEISGYGSHTLTEEQTRLVYERMKEHYGDT